MKQNFGDGYLAGVEQGKRAERLRVNRILLTQCVCDLRERTDCWAHAFMDLIREDACGND